MLTYRGIFYILITVHSMARHFWKFLPVHSSEHTSLHLTLDSVVNSTYSIWNIDHNIAIMLYYYIITIQIAWKQLNCPEGRWKSSISDFLPIEERKISTLVPDQTNSIGLRYNSIYYSKSKVAEPTICLNGCACAEWLFTVVGALWI